MRRIVLALIMALAIGPHVAAQQVSRHAAGAWQAIRELRAIGLPKVDDLEKGPPAKTPSLLRQLNRELRAMIVDTLNDRDRHEVPSEDETMDQLRSVGWDDVPDHKWNAFGEIVQINFDFKLGYEPGLLLVSTQLWIPCGSSDPDSAVYVFRGRARQWQLVLATDADFDSGSSAASGIQYQVSPPDDTGAWYLAVAHTPPDCRLRRGHGPQSTLRYKVLRPGKSPDEPVTVLSSRELIDPTFDPPFRIRAESDWFAATTGKQRKLDASQGVSIARYQIVGDRAKRIQPLALTAEDFFDSWVQLDRSEASHWTGDSNRGQLLEWHLKLNSLASDSAEMQHIYACARPNVDTASLLDVWFDQKTSPSFPAERLYVLVASRNGAFYVDSIGTSRPAGCQGEVTFQRSEGKLPDW